MQIKCQSVFHSRNVAHSRRKIKRTMNRRFRRECKMDIEGAYFRKGLHWELM
jgi:hypothetical protein